MFSTLPVNSYYLLKPPLEQFLVRLVAGDACERDLKFVHNVICPFTVGQFSCLVERFALQFYPSVCFKVQLLLCSSS